MKEKLKNISFRTRVSLLSIAMVLVPVALSVGAFFLIVNLIGRTEDYSIVSLILGHSIAQIFMIDMVTCIVAILLITVITMRRFIQQWFMEPLLELSIGMGNIAEGNLEYLLENRYTAEMGSLFDNYEQMRLRLKESAEESLENERINRELISNISHDLKTPITSIRGYVEGIMDGVADTPEKMEKYIRTIYNKSNELNRLINELTLYTNIDQNRVPYNFRPVKVEDFFLDCLDVMRLELEGANVRAVLHNETHPETVIIADPEQLSRVISNVISNSIKYRKGKDDYIDIRIADQNDSVLVEIEDNGKGIGAKELPHIFERFYRTDASRSSSTGGSGIGLSIVKKVIEDHGGLIWATGKLGEGTCIHFVLRKYKPEHEKDHQEIPDVKHPGEKQTGERQAV
ncbi:MAG: HAMP domain-containing histidine kinase [Lachnospiraceae bacterium]|nr:HAMP domain-containing histidine kinase [Lachnospiraceae bacterium]